MRNWDVPSTAYYVGINSRNPDAVIPLLGPFFDSPTDRRAVDVPDTMQLTAEWAAERCVARVKQIAEHIPDAPEPSQITAFPLVKPVKWLHWRLGEFAGFFPRVINYYDRRPVDTVQYWRSEHEPDSVRWVAFSEREPAAVVGRGELIVRDRRRPLEPLVRSRVERHDPILASTITSYRGDLEPRETPGHEPHEVVKIYAPHVDVGMVVRDPTDNKMKAITYYERTRGESDVQFTIGLSFDLYDPLNNKVDFDAYARLDVLDVFGFDIDMSRGYKREPERIIPARARPRGPQPIPISEGQIELSVDFGGMA